MITIPEPPEPPPEPPFPALWSSLTYPQAPLAPPQEYNQPELSPNSLVVES